MIFIGGTIRFKLKDKLNRINQNFYEATRSGISPLQSTFETV